MDPDDRVAAPQSLISMAMEHADPAYFCLLIEGYGDNEKNIHPEALPLATGRGKLEMLQAMVERYGLSAADSAATKKRAIELRRTKILSYLLTL